LIPKAIRSRSSICTISTTGPSVFVVGVTIRRAFDAKERAGDLQAFALLVLDELNKYAPRDGRAPIKEILLDVPSGVGVSASSSSDSQDRPPAVGRAQDFIANSSIRVVGRLDSARIRPR